MLELNPLFLAALVTGLVGLGLAVLRDVFTEFLKERISDDKVEPITRRVRAGMFVLALMLLIVAGFLAARDTRSVWPPGLSDEQLVRIVSECGSECSCDGRYLGVRTGERLYLSVGTGSGTAWRLRRRDDNSATITLVADGHVENGKHLGIEGQDVVLHRVESASTMWVVEHESLNAGLVRRVRVIFEAMLFDSPALEGRFLLRGRQAELYLDLYGGSCANNGAGDLVPAAVREAGAFWSLIAAP